MRSRARPLQSALWAGDGSSILPCRDSSACEDIAASASARRAGPRTKNAGVCRASSHQGCGSPDGGGGLSRSSPGDRFFVHASACTSLQRGSLWGWLRYRPLSKRPTRRAPARCSLRASLTRPWGASTIEAQAKEDQPCLDMNTSVRPAVERSSSGYRSASTTARPGMSRAWEQEVDSADHVVPTQTLRKA